MTRRYITSVWMPGPRQERPTPNLKPAPIDAVAFAALIAQLPPRSGK